MGKSADGKPMSGCRGLEEEMGGWRQGEQVTALGHGKCLTSMVVMDTHLCERTESHGLVPWN